MSRNYRYSRAQAIWMNIWAKISVITSKSDNKQQGRHSHNTPHQGTQEKARRVRQMERGILRIAA